MSDIAKLIDDLARAGVTLETHGDKLRYRPRDAMTADLAQRLRFHKACVLAYLRGGEAVSDKGGSFGPPLLLEPTDSPVIVEPGSNIGADNTSDAWGDCIDPGEPCPRCGSLLLWWPIAGGPRCLACDPPTAGIKALENAQRIRRRHGKADPPGAAELLAISKQFAGTCQYPKQLV